VSRSLVFTIFFSNRFLSYGLGLVFCGVSESLVESRVSGLSEG